MLRLQNHKFNTRNMKYNGPDIIGLVVFNETAKKLIDPVGAFDPRLQEAIQKLPEMVDGATNITAALRMAIETYQGVPRGIYRRLTLLSDGDPNREEDSIMAAVAEARRNFININTIGFGDAFNQGLLETIAGSTHNGKFYPVQSLRELTDSLIANSNHDIKAGNRRKSRMECSIFCIDISGSMDEAMGNTKKINVVCEALLRLLTYKQQVFS